MAKTQKTTTDWLQPLILKVAKLHLALVVMYAGFTIAYDAWNLTPAPLVLQRWTVFGIMAGISTVVWYFARATKQSHSFYKLLVLTLILMDIGLAAFSIYTERGMSSRGVMLFSLPIATSAILLSRGAIFATASLSAATYIVSAVRYFYIHPYEGYKVELYGVVGFYCLVFFILAGILATVAHSKRV